MRKKIYAICLVIAMVFTMTACGTSAKEEKKEEDKKVEESTADPEEEEEAEVVSEQGPYTGDTEISEAMKKELGASIAETFTKEYLEPNNINPKEYEWPSESALEEWSYFSAMTDLLYATVAAGIEFEHERNPSSFTDDPDEILFTHSIWNGILNWLGNHESYDKEFVGNLNFETLGPQGAFAHEYLSTYVTFK